MKIGAFSKKFNIPTGTIRYYINKGLLCPLIKNGRYVFAEKDLDDLKLLLKLKSFKFSIDDIHKLLSLWRLSGLNSENELNDYVNILNNQKQKLQREKLALNAIIKSIEAEVHGIVKVSPVHHNRNSGIPFIFLQYLACPLCKSSLTLKKCDIEKQHIISGSLLCKCGFYATIKDGILIGPSGKISEYDWPDRERNCYRLMNPTLLSYMQKAYNWIIDKLDQCDTNGKLILEDFINNYCFSHANIDKMNPDALYIITDKYPEIVALYKDLIDKSGLEYNILYIAAASDLLPIKDNSVDIYIDFDSANEYALYHSGYSTDAIARYLKRESCAVGAFFSFRPESKSIKILHSNFPEAWGKSYDVSFFRRYLHAMWEDTVEIESIGNVMDINIDEQASLYHIPGEVGMEVYFGKGFNKKSPKVMTDLT